MLAFCFLFIKESTICKKTLVNLGNVLPDKKLLFQKKHVALVISGAAVVCRGWDGRERSLRTSLDSNGSSVDQGEG